MQPRDIELEEGQRIVGSGSWDDLDLTGQTGTILLTDESNGEAKYYVRFDERFSGMLHNHRGVPDTPKQCWWCPASVLIPIEDDTATEYELPSLAGLFAEA